MIRHTKSQRIHGEVGARDPECDCRTVLLDMSATNTCWARRRQAVLTRSAPPEEGANEYCRK